MATTSGTVKALLNCPLCWCVDTTKGSEEIKDSGQAIRKDHKTIGNEINCLLLYMLYVV